MGNRWLNAVVVVFWLAMMSWLVVAKVLPPLNRGNPPDYHAALAATRPADSLVGWTMNWNNRELGWAATKVVDLPGGMIEVQSCVHFGRVPLEDIAPTLLRFALGAAADSAFKLRLDASSALQINAQGRLVEFRSSLRVPQLDETVRVQGVVEGSQLTLHIRNGQFEDTRQMYLPPDVLMGNDLSPQAIMPKLHLGQTWTVPVYSPLRPAASPVEVLQAAVEGRERIAWNGDSVTTMVVVYRADAGRGFSSVHEQRGRLWVDDEGKVLKQECSVYNSHLTFIRQSAAEAHKLLGRIARTPGWEHWSPEPVSSKADDLAAPKSTP